MNKQLQNRRKRHINSTHYTLPAPK